MTRSRKSLAPHTRPDPPPAPPEPTGDPFIDEVRRLKYEFAGRFDHDLDRMYEHLRERQATLQRAQPGRILHSLPPRPHDVDSPAA